MCVQRLWHPPPWSGRGHQSPGGTSNRMAHTLMTIAAILVDGLDGGCHPCARSRIAPSAQKLSGAKIITCAPDPNYLINRALGWSKSLERKLMRKIGYARVSTGSQNLDRQMSALRSERCHEVY